MSAYFARASRTPTDALFTRFGTYSVDLAINAGLDLEMPGPPRWRTPLLINHLLSCQKVKETTIDERVETLLLFVQRMAKRNPEIVYGDGIERTRESKDAQQFTRKLAAEGMVLLKNDGTLPLSKAIKKIALIGPWANATALMQGNYFGIAPYLISPLLGAQQAGFDVDYVFGANITTNDTSGFAAAVQAAKGADAIIFAGGLGENVESEELDRLNVTWPGNQLDLVRELAAVGKPLIVAQFGGGQLDDSALKADRAVRKLLFSA